MFFNHATPEKQEWVPLKVQVRSGYPGFLMNQGLFGLLKFTGLFEEI